MRAWVLLLAAGSAGAAAHAASDQQLAQAAVSRPRDLRLDFPVDRQERRQLSTGEEFFAANGTITNLGQDTQRVPTILIVLRDADERIVYSVDLEPPKRSLAPGESVDVAHAIIDVPRSAISLEIGWKPE